MHLHAIASDPMLRPPNHTKPATTYRMSVGPDNVPTLERFDVGGVMHGRMVDVPDWAAHVWAVAELGGFVLGSTVMPRRVVWFTHYGPPTNEVHVTDYREAEDNAPLIIPMENLYDDPEHPD